jgi:hypothetical protein
MLSIANMGLILFATVVPIEVLAMPDPQLPRISADMMPQAPRQMRTWDQR